MLPNLLIAGTQKSGTSWLHFALARSRHFAPSDRKETGFFVRPDWKSQIASYEAHFPAHTRARFVYESTPHYYRLPRKGEDVAQRIRELLGEPVLLVLLRDPVLRYESAYVHHVMKGRLPRVDVIRDVIDDHRLLSLGRYGEITEHWLGVHPRIRFVLYDDLADKPAVVDAVMRSCGVENDLPPARLEFGVNRKATKARELGWDAIPTLSDDARARLVDHYARDVEKLAGLIGRDLSGWSCGPRGSADRG